MSAITKHLIINLITIFSTFTAIAQNLDFEWFELIGGKGKTEGTCIAADNEGNVYVGGFFEGKIDAGGYILESEGGRDMILMKISINGELKWMKSFGGRHDDYISQLIYRDNSLIVAGTFSDTVQLADTILIADELGDLFIAEFNGEDDLTGIHRESGYGGIHLNELEIDDRGNHYITGRFIRELIVGDQVLNSTMYYDYNPWTGDSFPRYNENMFLVKYDPFFQAEWIKHYYQGKNSDWEEGLALEVDGNENVYFTIFNSDHPIEIEGLQISDWLFLSKLDPGGNMVWHVEAGPKRNVARPQSLLLDGDALYVGGQVGGNDIYVGDQIVVEDSWYDGFLCRFDTTGSLQWFEKIGEGSVLHTQGPSENMINSIHVFRDTIYTGGHFMYKIVDQNAGVYLDGKYDSFIAKFSRDGRMLDAGQRVVDSWSDISDMIVNERGIFFTGFSFEGNMSSNMPSWLIAGKVDLKNGSLGVEDIGNVEHEEIRIFPNPVSGQKIYIDTNQIEISDIKLFDSLGREIGLDQIEEYTRVIDIPYLKPGIYYLSLKVSGNKIIRRFIKL